MSQPAAASPVAGLRLAGHTIVAAVFGSIYLLGAARLLGPLEFSDLAVCMSMSYVGLLLLLGPLNLTLIRFSAAYQKHDAGSIRTLLWNSGRLYAPWVGAALVLSILFAEPIAETLNIATPSLVPWTMVLIGLGVALGAARAIAMGLQQHHLYSRSLLFESVLRVAAGGALVVFFVNAGAALAGFVIASAAALLIFGGLIWRRLPPSEVRSHESGDVPRFMIRALVFSAIAGGLQNADMIVAKMRLDPDAAGDYAVALAIARGFLLVAGPFASITLAGTTTAGPDGSSLGRIPSPLITYVLLCVPAVGLLFLVPGDVLTLLYGGYTPAQVQLVPLLASAFAVGGAFHVLAQSHIRSGQFGFVVPVGITVALEILILSLVQATPVAVAWSVLIANTLAVGCVVATPLLLKRS